MLTRFDNRSSGETTPSWGVAMASYQMVIIFLLPVILMSSSYYSVIIALWRSTKNMTALTSTSGGRAPGQPGLESGDEVTLARRGSLHGEASLYQAKPFRANITKNVQWSQVDAGWGGQLVASPKCH